MTGRRRRVAVLTVVTAFALTACSSSGSDKPARKTGVTVPTVSQVGPTSFTSAGPYKVGVRALTLPGEAKTPVEVWFPATAKAVAGTKTVDYNVADYLPKYLQGLFPPNFTGAVYQTDAHRDVPIADGRFPLVVFTHGFSGFRTQSTFLTTHLASWGFVVAAPELIDNDLTAVIGGSKAPGTSADIAEVRATISLLAKADDAAKGPFAGHVDMSHIGAVGHSLGGAVSEGVAAADPRVTTFIGLAGATVGSFGQSSSAATSTVPDKPGMLMVGTRDQVVAPAGMAKAYAAMKAPKRFVTMQGYGHLAFADICQIGGGKGGLTALAEQAGIPLPTQLKKLATDGCEPPATPVATGWPLIRQAVTAQLRHVFGFDKTTAALNGLTRAFPKVVATESVSN